MGEPGDAAEAFLARFTSWARERPDVRGALVVGSRARTVEPADPLSDVDLMVITTRPRFYVSTREWLYELGEPVVACTYSTVVGTRPVLSVDFNGGILPLHVDFAIVGGLESRWGSLLLRLLARRPGAMRLLPRGLADQVTSWFDALGKGVPRVLVDKRGAALGMFGFDPPPREHREPTTAEWDEVVNSFLSLCLWESKLLRRGERWMAAPGPTPPRIGSAGGCSVASPTREARSRRQILQSSDGRLPAGRSSHRRRPTPMRLPVV